MNICPQNRSVFILTALCFVALFAVAGTTIRQLARINPLNQLAAVTGAGSGLTGWWQLSDGSGTTASDSSGNGSNGTLVGFPTDNSEWVAGKTGTALAFDGSDHVTLPSGAGQIGSGDFTVSLWANYTDTAPGNTYLGAVSSAASGSLGTQTGYIITYFNSSDVAFAVSNNTGSSSSALDSSLSPGWHNIIGVFQNGVSVSLYVDGVLAQNSTTGVPSGNLTSPYQVRIGGFAEGADSPFVGDIQDVRTYNRALSSSEVGQIFSAGPTSTSGGGGGTSTSTPPSTYTLTVLLAGSGSGSVSGGSISCGSTCSQSNITGGTNITLTATPSGSSSFTSWSGCTSTTGASCSVTVNGNTNVTASFGTVSAPVVTDTTQSTFAASTTQISMTVATNETATCKYSQTAGTAYSAMTSTFGTTGGTSHSTAISGLSNGTSFTYYVRCADTNGNQDGADTAVTFNVLNSVTLPANAEVIGSEALQSFPESAEYDGVVNFSPGNGESVNINPPRFRWKYNPSTKADGCYNQICPAWAPLEFIFQVTNSSDTTFAHPIVNVLTLSNSYNFLAPFTQGQSYIWRIGYIHPNNISDASLSDQSLAQDSSPQMDLSSMTQNNTATWQQTANEWSLQNNAQPGGFGSNPTPYVWSATRSFTVPSSGATSWDRSMLANNNGEMQTALSAHPFLLFNNSNKDAMRTWLDQKEQVYLANTFSPVNNNDARIGQTWHQTKADASAAIGASWWTPSVTQNNVTATNTSDPANWVIPLGEAMFAYQLGLNAPSGSADQTLSARIAAADPGSMLVLLANNYASNDFGNGTCGDDENHNLSYEADTIAYGYDWLYNILTQPEKNQVLNDLQIALRADMYSGNFAIFYASASSTNLVHWCDSTGQYNTGHMVLDGSGSLFYGGEAHSYTNFNGSIPLALACYADGDFCKQYFGMAMNYMIGITYPFSPEGAPNAAGYSLAGLLPWDFGETLQQYMTATLALPSAQLNLNPFWKQNADYWDHYYPVGMIIAPSGWTDYSNGNLGYSFHQSAGWLAGYLQDPTLAEHWWNEGALENEPYNPNLYIFDGEYDFLPYLYNYPIPTSGTDTASPDVMYPDDGYAMGCSSPQSEASCFQNGVGYVFEAKPRGFAGSGNGGHSAFSDLNFDLWAYGTDLTATGATSEGSPTDLTWEYHPMMRNMVMVNGLGEVSQLSTPNTPFYNRIYAYEKTPDLVYVAADGTNGYPTRPNIYTDYGHDIYNAIQDDYPYYANSPLAGLEKVQRHLLFVKNKYFVIYDDLQSSVPYTYSWLYHILASPMTTPNTLPSSLSLSTSTASFSYVSNIEKFWFAFGNALASENVPGVVWRGLSSMTALSNETPPPDVPVFVKQMEDPGELKIQDLTGNARDENPITGENYSGGCATPSDPDYTVDPHTGVAVNGDKCEVSDGSGTYSTVNYLPLGQDVRSDALWFNTRTPQTNFHFMTVIYPENPADVTAGKPAPQITRIDDYTAKITDPDGNTDIISFNPQTAAANNATIVVDLSQLTPLPVVDDYTGTTVTSVPYVPPGNGGGTGTQTYSLSVSLAGSGTGTVTSSDNTISCGSACSESGIISGTTLTLTASSSGSSSFTSWSGCSTQNGNSCTVDMTGNTTVTATFSNSGGNNPPPPAPPVISSVASSNVSDTQATVSWTTDESASSQVLYGLTTAYGSQTALDSTLVTSHSQTIAGLAANTLYYYEVFSTNSTGGESTETGTFTTSASSGGSGYSGGGGGGGGGGAVNSTPPTIFNIGVSGTLNSGVSVSWNTSDAATSQVLYGLTTAYGSQTLLDPAYVTVHSEKLGTLVKNTLYHVEVRSTDASGLLATSPDVAFIVAANGSVYLATPAASSTSSRHGHAPITRYLYEGVTDSQVLTLQQTLNSNGYPVASSGTGSSGHETTYFGTATYAALKKFQCANLSVCSGTPATTGYGATGPKTRNALNALDVNGPASPSPLPLPSPASTSTASVTSWLYLGVTDPQVITLQKLLNADGYLVANSGPGSPGNEVDYFGSLTDAALRRFQCYKLDVCSGTPATSGYGATGPKTRAALSQI